MSEAADLPLRVGLIVEGPTDAIVAEAVFAAVLAEADRQNDFVVTVIQPEVSRAFGDAGPYGGGWKGVRGKCQEIGDRGGATAAGTLDNHDLLVVHVDGDVAEDDEVACASPCPPASATADALRAVLLGWLGSAEDIARVVLWVPMKETEAWLVPILRPGSKFDPAGIECRDQPSRLFAGGHPRLVSSGRKRPAKYRKVARDIETGWATARDRLSQARRFDGELRSALGAGTAVERD